MGQAKLIEQNGSKKVNNNKDLRVSAIKSKKITITTASIIFAGKKLLMISIKVTLLEGR